MTAGSKSTPPPPDAPRRDVRITRIIDAPRALVFEAWTDAKHLARWWGPQGFTNPVCEVDARPGGAINIVMRAANGVDYPMTAVFHEVVKPERLVFLATARDLDGKAVLESLTTATFEAQGIQTKLTVHASAVGLVPIAVNYLQGMEAGWTQSLERLADSASHPQVEGWDLACREIVTTRVLNFPRDVVFDAWTDPDKLKYWWGPKGFTNTFHQFEARPGGEWNFTMHGPDGKTYENQARFVEIVKPERIVIEHHSPPHFQILVTFDKLDAGGRTKLTFRQLFRTADVYNGVKVFALEPNEQIFDKLNAILYGT